jgi:hypothetical protein
VLSIGGTSAVAAEEQLPASAKARDEDGGGLIDALRIDA